MTQPEWGFVLAIMLASIVAAACLGAVAGAERGGTRMSGWWEKRWETVQLAPPVSVDGTLTTELKKLREEITALRLSIPEVTRAVAQTYETCASLMEAAVAKAVAEEREACAAILELAAKNNTQDEVVQDILYYMARQVRARGKHE